MKIKLIALLASLMLTVLSVSSDPVMGSTSKWGIVYSPCAWCGSIKKIEVHHIWPQHLYPQYAYDTNRMICLCRRCHLVLGHRGCFTNAVTNLIRMIAEGKK